MWWREQTHEGEGEGRGTNACDGEGACKKELGEEETFVVESRHMRGEGRTNVCGADGAFKND